MLLLIGKSNLGHQNAAYASKMNFTILQTPTTVFSVLYHSECQS